MKNKEYKYYSIAQRIISYIHEHRLFPGSRLPSLRTLAANFDISKNTVLKALEHLGDEGLITLRENHSACVSEDVWSNVDGYSVWQRYNKDILSNSTEKEFKSHLMKAHSDKLPIGTSCLSSDFNADRYLGYAIKDLHSYCLDKSVANELVMMEAEKAVAFHLYNKGIEASPTNIMLSTGPNNGVYCALKAFLKRGMYIIATDPSSSLFALNQIAQEAGAELVTVGLDEEGMLIDPIRNSKYSRRAVVMTSSVHHYPTGISMSTRRKRELLDLCKQMQIPIIESDLFSDCLPEKHSIKAMDEDNIVMYVGTIRHTFALGLNIGWLVLPEYLIDKVYEARSKITMYKDNITAAILKLLIHNGYYYDFLDQFLPLYRKRVDYANQLIEHYLGDTVKWDKKNSGFLFWLDFGEINVKQLFNDDDLLVSYGGMFSPKYKNHVSFCPFSVTEKELEKIVSDIRVRV